MFFYVTIATNTGRIIPLGLFYCDNKTFYLSGKGGGAYLPSKSALYFVLYMWLKE